MHFNLVRPCAECPFRRDIRPYLRPGRVRELERELVRGQKSFSCHATLDYSGERPKPTPKEEHCAGALIMLEKMDAPNQMMRWMERLHAYDRTQLDMEAPVYDDFEEMHAAAVEASHA